MPRVKIDTPGVTVEIDANEVSAKDLAALALELYKDAGGWPQTEARGIGFAVTEKRWTPDHRDTGYGGGFRQVKA
jgi:hypothetical protein